MFSHVSSVSHQRSLLHRTRSSQGRPQYPVGRPQNWQRAVAAKDDGRPRALDRLEYVPGSRSREPETSWKLVLVALTTKRRQSRGKCPTPETSWKLVLLWSGYCRSEGQSVRIRGEVVLGAGIEHRSLRFTSIRRSESRRFSMLFRFQRLLLVVLVASVTIVAAPRQ